MSHLLIMDGRLVSIVSYSRVTDPISRLLTIGSMPVYHSVLNVKALVGAYFNQEKALVGAFSVIVQLHRFIDLRH